MPPIPEVSVPFHGLHFLRPGLLIDFVTISANQLLAFQVAESADEAGVSEEDIDSQHTEEEASPLTPKEIKALRKLLKKKK